MKVGSYPTHHVLFDDSISGISQGWRYASITKIGNKWTYFKLFDGTDHTYKVLHRKWESLRKKDVKIEENAEKSTDHENVIDDVVDIKN